jgi:hypothetical protein
LLVVHILIPPLFHHITSPIHFPKKMNFVHEPSGVSITVNVFNNHNSHSGRVGLTGPIGLSASHENRRSGLSGLSGPSGLASYGRSGPSGPSGPSGDNGTFASRTDHSRRTFGPHGI